MVSDFLPPDAIQWHEGMLLAPQHFQQWSLRSEALLAYHLGAAAPFHWGVQRLAIDPSLLVDGTFRVTDLVAVMPDALLVSGGANGADLELDLTPHLDDIQARPMLVHLVVPVLKSDSPGKGELPRYDSAEGPAVADANTGEADLRIPRLRPRIGLILGDKPPEKYVSFPLAEIAYRNEALGLSDFVPPCLAVTTDSALGRRCADLAHALREKAVYLSERLQSPAAAAGAMVAETQGTIRSLVAALPRFEAVIGTGAAHPYTVYLGLCSVVGHLAALGGGMVPPALPPYNHNDLRGTFARPLEFAQRMIDSVREAYFAVPFSRVEGGFHLQLRNEWVSERLVIGARTRSGASEKDTTTWIEESLIGSDPFIQSMGDRRILGPGRRVIDMDETLGLMPTRGVVLFAVEGDPAFIKGDETLLILNRGDLKGERAPTEVVLYVAADGAGAGRP